MSVDFSHHLFLIIDNEDHLYDQSRQIVDVYLARGEAPHNIGDALKEWVEGVIEKQNPGFYDGATLATEMVSCALAEIDWTEVAREIIEEER